MITDKEFDKFVDENKVSKIMLKSIAVNIIKGTNLNEKELAIYKEWGSEIETLIKENIND